MYKNQLQELAQRSCFNLPSYACIREGPDHAPRFKASVNFNGELFESPGYCPTLRQAEHAAAEAALTNLSTRGPSRSLAARVLDETGVYKNLLQETAHMAGLKLPAYTTVRSGPGHSPVFTCSVELAGMSFAGEPAKTKKQAEKSAAMAAWSALKSMPNLGPLASHQKEPESSDEQEQAAVARVLSRFRAKEESRPVWQREREQLQRRRVMMHLHHWRTSAFPIQQQQKMGSLLALPAPTGPKILSLEPPSSSKDNSSNASYPSLSSSSRAIQDVPPPIEQQQKLGSLLAPTGSKILCQELFSSKDKNINPYPTLSSSNRAIQELPPPMGQKDETKWVGLTLDIKGKGVVEKEPRNAKPTQNPWRSSYLQSSPTQMSNKPFIPPMTHVRLPVTTAPMRNVPAAIPIPRMVRSGGFQRAGMAPAVHIRSVIPVCSAPPVRRQPGHQKEQEEISAGSLKINKLQL